MAWASLLLPAPKGKILCLFVPSFGTTQSESTFENLLLQVWRKCKPWIIGSDPVLISSCQGIYFQNLTFLFMLQSFLQTYYMTTKILVLRFIFILNYVS